MTLAPTIRSSRKPSAVSVPGGFWRRPRLLAHRITVAFAVTATTSVVVACSGILPKAEQVTESPWDSFDKAKAAYDAIEPGKTTTAQLRNLGYDPDAVANVSVLSYLEVIERFLPNESVRIEDLATGARECIQARTECRGYEVKPSVIHSKRVGNAVLDIFNFHRHTVRTGWSFEALVLLRNDSVLYKVWRGKPRLHQEEETTNPLGPLQDASGLLHWFVPPP